MREKDSFLSQKMERNNKKGLILESFQTLCSLFQERKKKLKTMLDNFPSNEKMFDNFISTFLHFTKNIVGFVGGDEVSSKNQILNKVPKFLADINRHLLPLFHGHPSYKNKVEEEINSLKNFVSKFTDQPTSPSTENVLPLPPKLKVSMLGLNTLKKTVGNQSLFLLASQNILTVDNSSPLISPTSSSSAPTVSVSASSPLQNEKQNPQKSRRPTLHKFKSSLNELNNLSKEILNVETLPETEIQKFISKFDIPDQNNPQLLCLKQGDVFILLKKATSDWWYGTNQTTGDIGFVFSTNLEEDVL